MKEYLVIFTDGMQTTVLGIDIMMALMQVSRRWDGTEIRSISLKD